MSSFGKKNYKAGCLKYFFFIVLIVFWTVYLIAQAVPKSYQMAKEELKERVFGEKEKPDTVFLRDTTTIIREIPTLGDTIKKDSTKKVIPPVDKNGHLDYTNNADI